MKSGKILRAMTRDGSARVLVTDATAIVERARILHHLTPMSTLCLGELLTGTSLIGSMMGEKQESMTVGIRTAGEAGSLLAVSDYYGNVRGYAENPALAIRLEDTGAPDIGATIGNGLFYVVHDTGSGEPMQGMIPAKSRGIAELFAAYFAESEQIPTMCSLGVLFHEDGTVRAAGGVLIQLLPSPAEETVDALERAAEGLSDVTGKLAAGETPLTVIESLLRDIPYDLFDEITTDYLCTCSRERMKRGILSLGQKEIQKLLDEQLRDGKTAELTAHCRFCGKDYTFGETELKEANEQKTD